MGMAIVSGSWGWGWIGTLGKSEGLGCLEVLIQHLSVAQRLQIRGQQMSLIWPTQFCFFGLFPFW
jgi:hypothetical protein